MKEEMDAAVMMAHAVEIVRQTQEKTELSLLQLGGIFRICAVACDEGHTIADRASMSAKFSSWRPK